MVVAAAVCWREGKVLLTRRPAGTHLEGFWEFPGGKVEPNEDPEETVRRECREECGIEINVHDILDVTFHRYERKNVLLLFYDCFLERGEVQHLEVAAHRWIAPESIADYRLPPPDERAVEKIVRRGAPLAESGD